MFQSACEEKIARTSEWKKKTQQGRTGGFGKITELCILWNVICRYVLLTEMWGANDEQAWALTHAFLNKAVTLFWWGRLVVHILPVLWEIVQQSWSGNSVRNLTACGNPWHAYRPGPNSLVWDQFKHLHKPACGSTVDMDPRPEIIIHQTTSHILSEKGTSLCQ